MDVLKIFQLRHSNVVAQPVYKWWNLLLPADFSTVNAYRLHTSLSWDKLIFLYSVTKMPRRWCHFILVKLHRQLWRQEERSRVGTSSSGCSLDYQEERSSFYVWSIIKIGIAIFKVPPSSKWYLPWRYMVCNFFVLSLVNNASYLQTFVFGLMLMHS